MDLAHAKLVSDVAVSSLSLGCPNLKHLNCHGVFMLADPRLSAPSKGAKLEAWQSLIGIAALAAHCPNLEILDLSGCFRLNVAMHQYVSSLAQLKKLNISACNQVASESLEQIAKGCVLLEEINFTDCGKGVNSKAMLAFSVHCSNLRVIIVCRCAQINGAAIKAIANCDKLEKLDVSGCRALTDTMLLPLCDVNKVANLRTINFSDLPAITDSILAWVAMRTHRILLFALRGTAVSRKAINSVKDRFPNSDFLQNDTFYGFWPKFRVDDRILLNNYHCFVNGVIRLQARLRSQLARKRVAGLALERMILAAHFLIQRIVRGFIGRKRALYKKMRALKIERQARLIANLFRIPVAKKKLMRKKRARYERFLQQCAIRIQQRWRMFSAKKKAAKKREQRRRYLARRNVCAAKIQSIVRLHFAVKRIRRIKDMIRGRENLINRKALMIQKKFRVFLAVRRTTHLRHFTARLKAERLASVLKIQQKFRMYRTQRILQVIQDARVHRLRCCIKIQALMRGALARLHVAEMMSDIIEQRWHKAAAKIQATMRMRLAMNEVKRMRIVRAKELDKCRAAANIIVGQCRVKVALIRTKRMRALVFERMKERARIEIASATKIQALQRGIMGRALFNEKLREKKGKWKELFDEKTNKRFFYNKQTGEVRWRIPQDLIDLIPRAPCDNCNYYEASVECAVCNEMFCGPCWDQVHYGGRRRDHEFRSLYDFYGRRMDYGDGVFPCKWPTEVIQDEIQGWMLRVAPLRQPLASYKCGWEEYADDSIPDKKSKLGETEKRTFFFNRHTFETTYTIPAEVQQEKDFEALKAANAQQMGGYYDENRNWVPTNLYIESWMTSNDPELSVLPSQRTGRSNNNYYDVAGSARIPSSGRLPPSAGMPSARIPSGRKSPEATGYWTGRSDVHDGVDSNVQRRLFYDEPAKKKR